MSGPATLTLARPLLGTMVLMRLEGGVGWREGADVDADVDVDAPGGTRPVPASPEAALADAAAAAFDAIAEVHRRLSFHEAGSDVRALARARPGERVRVAPVTASILARAQAWSRASGGAFDAGCGARAVAAGWLPAPDDAAPPGELPVEDALVIEDGPVVLVRSTTWLDVGGFAKGVAVDRAVAALRRHGVAGGVVNAGGDLRVFGGASETVQVRAPHDPSRVVPVATLRDGACATSASGAVSARPGSDAAPSESTLTSTPIDRPASGAPRSITVFAPTAGAADALTKIAWLQGAASRPLLRRARARALCIDADGRWTRW